MENANDVLKFITTDDIENELFREKYKFKYKKIFTNTLFVLVIVVAISVIIATFIFPVLQIYGDSMNNTLVSGDIVLCVKKQKFKQGDIVAFYYNNRVLVKRVVAVSTDWVNIDIDGNVFVNDELLDESYVIDKSYGDSDIEYPYQVPESSYFVLGDKRNNSIDSRNSLIGSVKQNDIIGKVVFRVWPFGRLGITK